MTTDKQQPAATVRLGAISGAIWRNPSDDGRVRYNTTFERLYVDANDEWKSTNSFGRDELLVLAKVCDLAHSRIHEMQAAEREAAKGQPANGNSPARTR